MAAIPAYPMVFARGASASGRPLRYTGGIASNPSYQFVTQNGNASLVSADFFAYVQAEAKARGVSPAVVFIEECRANNDVNSDWFTTAELATMAATTQVRPEYIQHDETSPF